MRGGSLWGLMTPGRGCVGARRCRGSHRGGDGDRRRGARAPLAPRSAASQLSSVPHAAVMDSTARGHESEHQAKHALIVPQGWPAGLWIAVRRRSGPDHPVGWTPLTLPLHPLRSLLPLDQPFTRAMARARRHRAPSLDRMLRDGLVHRLLRGVYAAAPRPTLDLRAAAVGPPSGGEAVAVDRTAAWVHGVDVGSGTASPRRSRCCPRTPPRGALGSGRQLAGRDVERIGGLRLTTPLRTALDLGRLLPPDPAFGAMDRLLPGGSFTARAAARGAGPARGQRGVGQLRTLAAQVDARSTCLAESVLRLHWHQARLPDRDAGDARRRRPAGPAEPGRRAPAVRRGARPPGQRGRPRGPRRGRLVGRRATEERVLRSDPCVWIQHLEREFHQHLLAQAGDEAESGGGLKWAAWTNQRWTRRTGRRRAQSAARRSNTPVMTSTRPTRSAPGAQPG